MQTLTDIRIYTGIIRREGDDLSLTGVKVVSEEWIHVYADDDSINIVRVPVGAACECEPQTIAEATPVCEQSGTNVLATLLRGADGKGVSGGYFEADGTLILVMEDGSKVSVGRINLSNYYTKKEVDGKKLPNPYGFNFSINGGSGAYDGVSSVYLKPIYAPETVGASGEVLISNGKGAPVWGSSTLFVKSEGIAQVARTGSYDDLKNKPSIPNEVTEDTITDWGFTKNNGTLTGIKVNGSALTRPEGGVLDIGSFQEPLMSGENIKSINGESILGEGDISAIAFAKDLTGVQEATAEEFTFRPSAGLKSIRDESAVIRRIKGNTSVWGQFADNPDFANGTSKWNRINTTLSIDRDGSMKVKHDIDGSQGFSQIFDDRHIPSGHKVLVVIDYKRSASTSKELLVYLRRESLAGFDIGRITVSSASRRTDGIIITTTEPSVAINIYPFIGGAVEDYTNVYSVNIFDLTAIYGAGNEPTTLDEFRELYPDSYYPYCVPEVRSMRATGIETIGFNAFNGEYAEVLGGLRYCLSGNITRLGFCETIGGGITTIPIPEDGMYTPSRRGFLYAVGSDICIHLVHSGVCNGEHHDYERNVRLLPDIATYFPEGMHGIGDVYDEINEENAVKRFGVVDLGTLTWFETDTKAGTRRFGSYGISELAEWPSANNVLANIVCVKYDRGAADDTYLDIHCIAISRAGVLFVYDPNYNTTGSLANFVASLQGVLLYYELAVPIVTPITEPLQLDYKVADFGTEKMLSDLPSSPFRADIVYQFNAEGRIRDNSRNIERLEDKVKNMATVPSDIAETYTTKFDVYDLSRGNTVNDIETSNLVQAISAGKIILVPFDKNTPALGKLVAIAYVEDYIYMTVIDAPYLYMLEISQYVNTLYADAITKMELQPILSSGKNIKTINGESILGSGNITISGGGGASGSAQLPVYYISDNLGRSYPISSGMVTIFSTPQTVGMNMVLSTEDMESGKDSAWVIRLSIGADNTGAYVVLAEDNFSIKWANGIAPTFENGKMYELSFRKLGSYFLGVWASFE